MNNQDSDLTKQNEENSGTNDSTNDTFFKISVRKEPFQIKSITQIDTNTTNNNTNNNIIQEEITNTSNPTTSTRNPKRNQEDLNSSCDNSSINDNDTDTNNNNSNQESKRQKSEPKKHIENKIHNEDSSSDTDVDLSDVKLVKKTKSHQQEKQENNNQKNEELDKKPVETDPSKPDYWSIIFESEFYKENSLKIKDIINREFGLKNKYFGFETPRKYINKAISSLELVRRMKLSHNLSYHDGCVNSLNFNRIGTLLVSGSDDYQVCLWDWARNNLVLTFDSGHKSNVFQTKFMPFTGDSQIVTCARDGQVRLALISSSGTHIGTKKLAKHADSCHKLAIEYDSCNLFLSCGEDGVVYEIDLRQQSPAKILTVKYPNRNYKLPLYSVASNPFDTYQFIVTGKDQYIRLYDKRMLVNEQKVLRVYTPSHMKDVQRASITSAVFNQTGSEIIASYSDDDIYLFETDQKNDDNIEFKYRYKGHRNSDTIKGVNFYGSNSDYIVSGSDCGRLFFWEKSTQQIVNVQKGDENGIVNCLEPHPNFPIIATSGLDSDIKMWSPISDTPSSLENLNEIISENQRNRDQSRHFSLSNFEFELLLLLMHRPHNRVFFRARDGELRSTWRQNDDSNHTTGSSNEDENDELSRSGTSLRTRLSRYIIDEEDNNENEDEDEEDFNDDEDSDEDDNIDFDDNDDTDDTDDDDDDDYHDFWDNRNLMEERDESINNYQ